MTSSKRFGLEPEDVEDVGVAAEVPALGMVHTEALEVSGAHRGTAAGSTDRPLTAPEHSGVALILRNCAERFDGSGSPDGRAGGAIPIGSRIVAAIEAYSSAAERLGVSGLPAYRELASGVLDPEVVSALGAMLDADRPQRAAESL